MAKPQGNLLRKAIERITDLRHRKPATIPNAPARSTTQERSPRRESLSATKKKKLEALYNRILADKDFIISGKLQFLNFQQVRTALGARWHNVKNIIYTLTEEVIEKYTDEDDISFRYKEDYYIVIFPNATLEEGRLKCALIATEIKKLLAEEQKNNEKMRDLRDIDLSHAVKLVPSVDIINKGSRMRTVSEDFDKQQTRTVTDADIAALMASGTEIMIEAPAGPSTRTTPPATTEETSAEEEFAYFYLPVWSKATGDIYSYLGLAQKKTATDPLESYYSLLASASATSTANIDVCILRQVRQQFSSSEWISAPYHLAVPVHHSTLQNSQTFRDYLIECQKLLPEHRKSLCFFVSDIPENASKVTLQKTLAPMKNYAGAVAISFSGPSVKDIAGYVNCGVTAMALEIKSLSRSSEQDYATRMQSFVNQARQYRLKSILILNAKSEKLLHAGMSSGFDLIGGNGIEDPITDPPKKDKFANI